MASRKPAQKKKDKRATVVFFTAVAVLLLALVLLLVFAVFRPAGRQGADRRPHPFANGERRAHADAVRAPHGHHPRRGRCDDAR